MTKNNRVYRTLMVNLFTLIAFSNLVLAEESATITEEASSPWRLSASDRFIFSNAKDQPGARGKISNLWMNEGRVQTEYAKFNGDLHFSNRFLLIDKNSANTPFTLEKYGVGASWETLDLRAGHAYQELGQGIALSLYRDTTFGIDNTVEGGSVRFHPESWDVTAFVGRARAIENPVAINPLATPLSDYDVFLAGGKISHSFTNDFKLQSHYLLAQRSPKGKNVDLEWNTIGGGVTWENLVDGTDLYAESNLLLSDRIGRTRDRLNNGYGSYASLSSSFDSFRLKLEGKDYRNYRFPLRRPPTLEEDIVETLNIEDVSAAKAKAEYRFAETQATVFTSYLQGQDRIVNDSLSHVVAGAKYKTAARIETELKGGYRWLPQTENMVHTSIKAKIPTFKAQAFEVGYRKQYSHKNISVLPTVEDRNFIDLAYTFSERWGISLGYEFLPRNSDSEGQHFANVGATYRQGSLATRAFAGQTSGGTLCSGGVCRQVPPYTGAQLEASVSF